MGFTGVSSEKSAFLRKNTQSKTNLKYSGRRGTLGCFTGVSSARISISKINLKYRDKRGTLCDFTGVSSARISIFEKEYPLKDKLKIQW